MPLMTLTAYATYRGVSRRAVYDALETGRISRAPDGKIDSEAADAAWARNTHIVPEAVTAGKRRDPEEEDVAPKRGTVAWSQYQRNLVKLEDEKLDLEKKKGMLLDAVAVRSAQFQRAEAEREALLNWPSSIAAEVAAKLGVTERDVFLALDIEVRKYLDLRSNQSAGQKAA